jgi:hypothetical protein
LDKKAEHSTTLEQSIDYTLGYFELFNYPLQANEIHQFLDVKCSLSEVEEHLLYLKNSGTIFQSEQGFYSRLQQPGWSVERQYGKQRAELLLRKSARFVRIMKRFPFVDGIGISGSLSKYYADKDADIDYFIITRTNRLWIARTLLHLYKKLTFLRGHQDYYCMNFFVDQSALEIIQKNVFTAIELVTLIPVYQLENIIQLKKQNAWLLRFLPNTDFVQDERFLVPCGNEFLKRGIEKFINLLCPERLNRFLMRLTDRKWRAKWRRKSFPMEHYDDAMYTSLHVSKNHPANYQEQVLNALKNKQKLIPQPTCLR